MSGENLAAGDSMWLADHMEPADDYDGGEVRRVKKKKRRTEPSTTPKEAKRWTADEAERFQAGLAAHGRDWKAIALQFPGRKPDAVRSYAARVLIEMWFKRTPLPPKVLESGSGYTTSGKPLDLSHRSVLSIAQRNESNRLRLQEAQLDLSERSLSSVCLGSSTKALRGFASSSQGGRSPFSAATPALSAPQRSFSHACLPPLVTALLLDQIESGHETSANAVNTYLSRGVGDAAAEATERSSYAKSRLRRGRAASSSDMAAMLALAASDEPSIFDEAVMEPVESIRDDSQTQPDSLLHSEHSQHSLSNIAPNSTSATSATAPSSSSSRLKHQTTSDYVRLNDAVHNPHQLLRCARYGTPGSEVFGKQPFTIDVAATALLVMDFHAHLAHTEIIGLLGGLWDPIAQHLIILEAFPAKALRMDCNEGSINVEMDPEAQVEITETIGARHMRVVGWYHSHPTFPPVPSSRDAENQNNYQVLFRDEECAVPPFVGLIVGPYDVDMPSVASVVNAFHVARAAVPLVDREGEGQATKGLEEDVGKEREAMKEEEEDEEEEEERVAREAIKEEEEEGKMGEGDVLKAMERGTSEGEATKMEEKVTVAENVMLSKEEEEEGVNGGAPDVGQEGLGVVAMEVGTKTECDEVPRQSAPVVSRTAVVSVMTLDWSTQVVEEEAPVAMAWKQIEALVSEYLTFPERFHGFGDLWRAADEQTGLPNLSYFDSFFESLERHAGFILTKDASSIAARAIQLIVDRWGE